MEISIAKIIMTNVFNLLISSPYLSIISGEVSNPIPTKLKRISEQINTCIQVLSKIKQHLRLKPFIVLIAINYPRLIIMRNFWLLWKLIFFDRIQIEIHFEI